MPRDGSGVYSQPPGTHGTPNTTILSAAYNANVDDVAADLNTPRPIVAGGTGSTTPAAALTALGAVAKAGDTMTGNLTLQSGGPSLALNSTGANPNSVLAFKFTGFPRWQIFTANADSPSSGSDLLFGSYNNAGTLLNGYPLSITRATGQATFNAQIQATGGINCPVVGAGVTVGPTGTGVAYDGTFLTLISGSGAGNILIGNSGSGFTYFRNANGFAFQNLAGAACFSIGLDGTIKAFSNAANNAGYYMYSNVGNLIGRLYAADTQDVSFQNNYIGSTLTLAFNGGLSFTGAYAGKPGGGVWNDTSDIRIKTVTGDYKAGLDEILKLKPRTFTYQGNDTAQPPANALAGLEVEGDKSAPAVPYANSPHAIVAKSGQEFIGLIAQEAETVMPEMVTRHDGYIDGEPVTDLRVLDPNALVYALINSVQTLTARIEALEAA